MEEIGNFRDWDGVFGSKPWENQDKGNAHPGALPLLNDYR